MIKSTFSLLLVLLCFNQSKAQKIETISAEQVQTIIKQKTDKKVVVINVWATWCGPCVEEFPDLVELAEKYSKEIEVMFISADFLEDIDRVKEFLVNQKVTWPTYIKTGSESDFIEALHPNWTGALPFSIILKKGGTEIAHWENKAEMSKFEASIKQALKSKPEKQK